jgi:molybdenum cofactor biosynthesis protein B
MSVHEHRAHSPKTVSCVVITVSDTRTLETDTGGAEAVRSLETHGHQVLRREVVPDDLTRIREAVGAALDEPGVRAVITTGGTGIARRDVTFEAVSSLFDKPLDGFGEIFRVLSYQEIGAAAILSRACAGVAHGKIVVALPGSEAAVRLAMEKLVGPELAHMVREAGR